MLNEFRSDNAETQAAESAQFMNIVGKCRACGALILFYERTAHQGPVVACESCHRDWTASFRDVGWIDAKFRDDEQAQHDTVVMHLTEILMRLSHDELMDLYAEGWMSDPLNVVIKLRPAGDAGPLIEICHDLQHACERAFCGGVPRG